MTLDKLWNDCFPDGNYYMYWLYVSFICMFPILLMCFVLCLSLMNYGYTISTDSFVAEMRLATSYRCSQLVIDIIATLLNWTSYLWVALLIHTGISAVSDIHQIAERRNDL